MPIDFATFAPNYHELDRIGVVSPALEDGILHTGSALLAFTTAFYDAHRARTTDFFDYPQHFAFVCANDEGLSSRFGLLSNQLPGLWDAWSWLDVWPQNKWIPSPTTATGMLQQVFDYQINRLFWPRHLRPEAGEAPLPEYAYKMLRTRLKSVFYFEPFGTQQPPLSTVEIRCNQAGATVKQESLDKLPALVQTGLAARTLAVERFYPIAVDEFVETMR